jgi:hypothetical protein
MDVVLITFGVAMDKKQQTKYISKENPNIA